MVMTTAHPVIAWQHFDKQMRKRPHRGLYFLIFEFKEMDFAVKSRCNGKMVNGTYMVYSMQNPTVK